MHTHLFPSNIFESMRTRRGPYEVTVKTKTSNRVLSFRPYKGCLLLRTCMGIGPRPHSLTYKKKGHPSPFPQIPRFSHTCQDGHTRPFTCAPNCPNMDVK